MNCSVALCNKRSSRRGLCTMHYYRRLRHGDVHQTSRNAVGTHARYLNDVVLNYHGNDCLAWPYSRNGKGYGQIKIGGRACIVSRIVCEKAHGKPPTPEYEAAHSCGNGHFGCVTKRHISWKTAAENNADKLTHGTLIRGEKSPNSRLTTEQVTHIWGLKGYHSKTDIASMFGVSRSAVSDIHSGKNWAWLTSALRSDDS